MTAEATLDADIFAARYDEHADVLFGFVMNRVWHRQTAEDLVSEIWMKALSKKEQFNPEKASYKTWLFQIARNHIIDHLRARKETKNIDDMWDLTDDTDIPHDTEITLQLEKIKEDMQHLSPLQREIVTLRVWHDLSHAEIAQIVGKKESAVKMTFSRAISQLRAETLLLLLAFTRIPS